MKHRFTIEVEVNEKRLADEAEAVRRGLMDATSVPVQPAAWDSVDLQRALRLDYARHVEIFDYETVLSPEERREMDVAQTRERDAWGND